MGENEKSNVIAGEYPPHNHILRDLRVSLEFQGKGRAVIRAPVVREICTQDGSLQIEFHSCNRATVNYDLGTANRSGEIPVQTAVDDHVELCESITNVPGMPGPL